MKKNKKANIGFLVFLASSSSQFCGENNACSNLLKEIYARMPQKRLLAETFTEGGGLRIPERAPSSKKV